MLTLTNISKSFPGVRALSDVSLTVQAGEVHALCGENGAGKSTLMNIITGNLSPDTGTIELNGKRVTIDSPQQARALGIGMVHQERSLVDTLSVAENIFPDTQPRNCWGLINFGALYAKTQALLDRLQLRLSPRMLVGRLSPGQKQQVDIAKALALNPRLLILDEPTASITETETETLFSIMRDLRQQGVAIIYISHRMAEIQTIADRVSVLKDGQYQGTVDAATTSSDQIIRMMVGRELARMERKTHATNTVALDVRGLSGRRFQDVSFTLHRGEILGMAGLVGAGRTEVARAIFGADPITAGEIWKDGQRILVRHPADAVRYRMGYVPEERKTAGLFMDRSVADNIAVAHLDALAPSGLIDNREITRLAEEYRQQLTIRTPSVAQKVGKLSGGNGQKVVLARWLTIRPEVLIVDEPTHGVDVGAKAEIYTLLRQLATNGTAILLISSELPEVLTMADRVLVMHEGRLAGILNGTDLTEEHVMTLMS